MFARGRIVIGLVALVPAMGASAPSQQGARQELTLENIHRRNHGAGDAALSPGGERVAVTASAADGRHVWVAPTDGSRPPRRVAPGSGPAWTPDGTAIVYRAEGDLWIVGVAGGEPRRLTDDEHDERAPVVSPDGRTVAFFSSRSGSQDLWLLPLEAGGDSEPRQLTHAAMDVDDPRFAPAWSPDGATVAFVSNRADPWHDDVWTIDVASGESRQVSFGLMASSTPVYSPDGRTIALLGTAKDEYWYEDLAYIYLLDVDPAAADRGGDASAAAGPAAEGGALDRERILPMQIHATDWLHNHRLFWSEDGERLYFLYHERGDLNLWSVSSAGGVATRVTNVGGAVRSFHASAAGDAFVLVRSEPTRGYDVDFVDARGGEPRRLTHFAPEWDGLQDPVEISYRSFDGLYIQGFLYRPPGYEDVVATPGDRATDAAATTTFPSLVNVHGGGTNSYLRRDNLIEQYLASRGYVVLAVNYRGGSGFGREFQDLAINDWANRQALDAAAAADVMRSLPGSNGKVGIYGYSYGGITSMAAIARAPEAFDAAVPMAGIYDFADAYETADRLGRIFIKTGHGGSPDERPEIYAISDTLARLGNVRTPLLVMHGQEDVRAPYRQFELAVARLREAGKRFESHSYPGEPHGFRNPDNRIDIYRRLETFFREHLR